MHNSAHLSPLAVSYFCNGTGRDTYISKDGGGLYNPPNKTTQYSIGTFRENQLSPSRSANVLMPAKQVHYHSDGSGRDTYIGVNEGGFTGNTKKLNYIHTLREYDVSPERARSLSKSQFLPTLQQALKNEQIYKSQVMNTARLSQHRAYTEAYKDSRQKLQLPGIRRIC